MDGLTDCPDMTIEVYRGCKTTIQQHKQDNPIIKNWQVRQNYMGKPKQYPVCFSDCVKTCTVELQWLEHCWLVYHGCFEQVLKSLGNNLIAADL